MKPKKKSLGLNAILNAIKSGLSIVFPLITYPYAFRVLHVEGIGKVNYANSIETYFLLIAALGITSYATREGAKLRDDQKKLSIFANQIFTINIISTLVAYGILGLCLALIKPLQDYTLLILLQSSSIIFTTLGIEWVNNIFEDYLFITIRSIIIYVVTLVMMFLIVRTEEDYYKYVFLSVFTQILICVSNWIYCRRYIKIRITTQLNLRKHFCPIFVMFANAIAINIYVNSDVTMIGWIQGDYCVGIYECAVKIYTVIKRMIAAMYTVAIPRISYYIGMGDKESIRKTYTTLFSSITLFLLPASVGLTCVSREVIWLLGGGEYAEAVTALRILSLSLIGAVLGGLVTNSLNIPLGREKLSARATILSAIINIWLNVILIPVFKQNGAAITTVVSEFFVLTYCVCKTKDIGKLLDIKCWGKCFLHAGAGCMTIILIAFGIHKFIDRPLASLLAIMALSILSYLIELFVLRNELMIDIASHFIGLMRRPEQ